MTTRLTYVPGAPNWLDLGVPDVDAAASFELEEAVAAAFRPGGLERPAEDTAGRALEFVARQVQVPAAELDAYEWSGRTVEYHRAQIREHLGFRECSVADADKLTGVRLGIPYIHGL
ncbi:DUF4158 domain-containing protein [Streptomyces sp. NPDC059349]|uniref:DUF4158 domain-containing protein n=1 Tax=Streptomyces sp. NPDC059349 TaxID=3346808 RepID=UPI003685596B